MSSEVAEDERFAYNGVGGGRVFKWYRKGTFKWCLRQVGWKGAGDDFTRTCTERQVMKALRDTSDWLGKFPMETNCMEQYAGPQCFPQIREAARRGANSSARKVVQDDDAGIALPEAREQMT